jgi:hypothetical protein
MRSSHRLSKGLIYFPLKTNILNNDKVKILRADSGNEGFACLIILLIKIYGNDYFRKFGLRERKLFCDDEKFSKLQLEEILETCFSEEIFHRGMYDKYEILTSESIQEIWSEVTYRRDEIIMIDEYILINKEEMSGADRLSIIDLSGKYLQHSKRKAQKESRNQSEKPVVPAKPKAPEQPAKPDEKSPEFLPGYKPTPHEEIIRFCLLDYDKQNEAFKAQVDKSWFDRFKKFNEFIDKDYKPLRISSLQLTYPDFVKISTEPISGIVPTRAELKEAIKKMTQTGVGINGSIYHKLRQYVDYVREVKPNGKVNGHTPMAGGSGLKIDHSSSAKNF